MERKKDAIAFLREYETLCKKYKISIEGCGCCGSPFLVVRTESGSEDVSLENIGFADNKVYIEYKTIDELDKGEDNE